MLYMYKQITNMVLTNLNESSLSRVRTHVMNHDTAMITSWRDKLNNCTEDQKTLPENNRERNNILKALLLAEGFGVTKVDGSYIENFKELDAVEVKEDSFFVVNLKDNNNFTNKIIELGKLFCQDSVLIVPKGGISAYLYGTNLSQFPSLDKTVNVGDLKFGKESEFMTKVNNRPFVFESYSDFNKSQRMAIKAIQRKYS